MWSRSKRRKPKPRTQPKREEEEIVPGVTRENLQAFENSFERRIHYMFRESPANYGYLDEEMKGIFYLLETDNAWGGFVKHVKRNHLEFIESYICLRDALDVPYFKRKFNFDKDSLFEAYLNIYLGFYQKVAEELQKVAENIEEYYPNESRSRQRALRENYVQAFKRYKLIILKPSDPNFIQHLRCKSGKLKLLVDAQYSGGNSFGRVPSGRRGRLVRKQYRGFV